MSLKTSPMIVENDGMYIVYYDPHVVGKFLCVLGMNKAFGIHKEHPLMRRPRDTQR